MDIVKALREEGCSVVEQGAWQQRGGASFAPEGVLVHHTAGAQGSVTRSLQTVIQGREDVPGPLCHLYIDRAGSVHTIAARRANHAGKGAQEVLDDLRANRAPTGDAAQRGLADSTSGNTFFYGIEVENDGVGEAYPDAVIEATARACAALCRAHGWSSSRVIHHREWTRRKIDMSYHGPLRDKVDALLQQPPAG